MNKLLLIFLIGFLEQLLYTFYILAVGRYLVLVSSLMMFGYMVIYLLIINRIAKDKEDSIKMSIVYALSCGIGNFVAMIMHIIK